MGKISRTGFLKLVASLLGGWLGAALLNACGVPVDEAAPAAPTVAGQPAVPATGAPAPTASSSPARSEADESRLRGMAVMWNERMKVRGSHTLADSPSKSWFTFEDAARLRQAGATCLEMHQIGLPELMPERDAPDEAFFARWVDTWVDWCAQNRLHCILNVTGFGAWADWAFFLSMPGWLWDGFPQAPTLADKPACDSFIRDFFDLDAAGQDRNRAAFLNLWKYIAARYHGHPNVIFSIMNEPFWNVEIPDAAAAVRLGKSYSAFMEQIVAGIRGEGARQRIFIDLPFLMDADWRFTVRPVEGEDVVWEAHAYGNIWEPHNGTFEQIADSLVRLFVEDFQRPLFIGEYGFNPIRSIRTDNGSDWKAMLQGMTAYLDGLPVLGRQFVAWDYLCGEYGCFSGESDLSTAESNWILETVLS
ncbi:MAG: cellulase family glycosylhydrolase [Anaerolineales bacterium]|nr:cellulase family glycosylhydrolase [Anaerolineales bacterium]